MQFLDKKTVKVAAEAISNRKIVLWQKNKSYAQRDVTPCAEGV